MSRRLEGKRALVTGAREALGGLDIVVAGAGVATCFKPVHKVDPSYWERVIGIDLTGVFHTLHAALPILRVQGPGVVLTLSSIEADACHANGGQC